jgi:hypothetical protein
MTNKVADIPILYRNNLLKSLTLLFLLDIGTVVLAIHFISRKEAITFVLVINKEVHYATNCYFNEQ